MGPHIPHLCFKPPHAAISEGLHVAIGISSKATDINKLEMLKYRMFKLNQFSKISLSGLLFVISAPSLQRHFACRNLP